MIKVGDTNPRNGEVEGGGGVFDLNRDDRQNNEALRTAAASPSLTLNALHKQCRFEMKDMHG